MFDIRKIVIVAILLCVVACSGQQPPAQNTTDETPAQDAEVYQEDFESGEVDGSAEEGLGETVDDATEKGATADDTSAGE